MFSQFRSGHKLINQYFSVLVLSILFVAFVLRVVNLSSPTHYMFDEDFFAFTAKLHLENDQRVFEWWHGPLESEKNQYAYRAPAIDWLHGPVSKTIQAGFIGLMEDSSLAWRLPSAIAGVLVVTLTIVLTKNLFGSSTLAVIAGLLTTFEQLLIVQSRIASPDIYLILFTLITIWSYWRYYQQKSIGWLVFTGFFLGLACATKWSGLFLLLGLTGHSLIITFWQAKKNQRFRKYQLALVAVATLVLVATATYLLSYWQLFLQGKNFTFFFSLQQQIWQYQATTQFDHPSASHPWQWILGEKPVWYYYDNQNGSSAEIIAKPSWWILVTGFPAILFITYQLKKNKLANSKRDAYVLVVLCVLALYLPWFLISRPLFIYHFAPIIPLLSIGVAGVLPDLFTGIKKKAT